AEPMAFVDYLAVDDPNPELTREIGKGLAEGARLANISIIGGETADLPELINGFDLAGTCLGYVKKKNIILGDKIKPGDIIIGLSSTGLHSNGYTLARRVVESNNLSYNDKFPEGLYPNKSIGEILLTPTRIYVKEILALTRNIKVHGLAHITGSGLRNLPRLKENVKYIIDNPLPAQPVFKFLQKYGNIEDKEMYQTFNMGMGFTIITSEKDADKAIRILKRYSEAEVKIVGYVDKGRGVSIPSLDILYTDHKKR
ncbi:MAG: phosphoribosylformylglycinamidine cyclo-ligase, partial [Candidatus Thermoplasmatota archaeon]